MKYAGVVLAVVLAFGCDKKGDDKAGSAAGSATPAAGSATKAAGSATAAGSAAAAESKIAAAGSAGLGAPQNGTDADAPPGAGPGSAIVTPPKVGDRVSAQWTSGSWYPGKIAAINADGTFDINYDDGDKSKALPASKVRIVPPPRTDWKVGEKVQGKWTDGSWYAGTIAAVNTDGTFKVKYDDGDVSDALKPAHVRAIPPKSTSTAKASGGDTNPNCPGPGITRRCNGKCVNLQEDDNNCGACGNVCRDGYHCDGHLFCRDAEGNL